MGENTDERSSLEGSKGNSVGVHPFLPISSSAPSSTSSNIVLNWGVAASEASSTSTTPVVTALPTTSTTVVEKEHMFEKVVTPSDVGKLNRLVIPKQHAEKYFPLDASSSTHEKGLLLNFEDRSGKPWRFRYSYWNSSQSYVMTKGWSRFVKEKRLDAGDTVSFGRGSNETSRHRLFIDWKRRPDPHLNQPLASIRRFPYNQYSNNNLVTPEAASPRPHPYLSFTRSANAPWAAGRLFVRHANPPPASSSNYVYFRAPTTTPAPPPDVPMVLESIPVAHGTAITDQPNRLRLFGVNLEQPREAANRAETVDLLRLQLRAPLPSPESRTVDDSSSSSSSTRGAPKDTQHLDYSTCDTYFKLN